MDINDWLTENHSNMERNPYLSLISKIANLDDEDFEKGILAILNTNGFAENEKKIIDKLESVGILSKESIFIDAMLSNCPLERITKLISWYDFEKLTGKILDRAGWHVTINFRYFGEGGQTRDRHRYEVDVIAWKKPFVLLIDNKRHTKTSKSYLTTAVEKQQSRTYELFDMIPIIHELPEIQWSKKWDKAILLPIIVTWKEHGILDINGSPIVSSSTLLDLLNNLRLYFDERSWFHLTWSKI